MYKGRSGLRFKVVISSFTMIIIVASLIPIAEADTVILLNEGDVGLIPTVFGNRTADGGEAIMGFTVADDGKMYTVSYNPLWRLVRGQTPVSLIAWGSDGVVRWSHKTNHFDRVYCDVTSDQSNIYVVGTWNNDILVEKISFEGDLVWNSTIDMGGQTERGYEISLMGDGTIIVGGSRWPSTEHFPPIERNYILLALNQTGHTQWAYDFQEYPSPRCDSDYLYITTGNTLEKWESNGPSVWSTNYNDGRLGSASDNIVYTISSIPFIERYERYSFSQIIEYSTEVEVTTWSSDTGEEKRSTNLMLWEADQQPFNCSRVDTAIDQDGSIRILMQVDEMESWYLMGLNQNAELTSFIKLLEGQWYNAQFEMDDSGNAYIATTSATQSYASITYELTVMKFDAEQIMSTLTSTSTSTAVTTTGTTGFAELTTSQMIAVAFVAVVIIDMVLIVLLKQKWSGRG